MTVPTVRRVAAVLVLLVVVTGCQDRAVTTGTAGVAPPTAGSAPTATTSSIASATAVPTGTSSPSGTSSTPAAAPVAGPKKPTVLWTSNDPQPLGQPVVAGSDIAIYTQTNTVPYIQVMDPATGRTLWRRPTSFGDAAPGVAVSPLVVADKLIYLRPGETDSKWTQLVIADIRTGRDLWVSKDAFDITQRPDECDGQVCFVGWLDGKQQRHRVQVPSGKMTTLPSSPGRLVGPDGLTSTQIDGRPEMLERQVNGKTLWSKKLSEYFGPGYSTNGGWSFSSYDRRKVLVGTVGTYDPKEPSNSGIPLGRSKMVGIDTQTGARLWVQSGVDDFCLPDLDDTVTVRCRWGSNSVLGRVLKSGALTIEGFQPATGKTTWRVPLVDPTEKTWEQVQAMVKTTSDGKLAVAAERGPLVIDPATGTNAAPTAATRFICSADIDTQIWGQGFDYQGTPVNASYTGTARFPCDLGGHAVAFDAPWPRGAGATVKDVQVVTTPTGLQASTMRAGATATTRTTAAAPHPSSANPTTPAAGSTAAAAPPSKAVPAAWTATGGVPLSQPVAAGRVALAYFWQDERLMLRAVDPATGRTVWQRQASAGSFPNDFITPAAVGGTVVYLRGEPNRTVQVVVADSQSGHDIHVTTAFFNVIDWPWVCGPDVCFDRRLDSGPVTSRIDVASGLVDGRPPYDGSTQLQVGGNLALTYQLGKASRLVAIDRGDATFAVPALSVVPASYEAFSNTFSRAFQWWSSAGVYVGRLGDAYDPDHPRYTRELGTRSRMVAVDTKTGKVVWTTTGTNNDCLPASFTDGNYGYPVRCRWAQNAVDTYRDGSWTRQNGRVSVEGFDPRTGRTTWSVALADQSGPVSSLFVPRAAGQDTLLAKGVNGLLLISLRDGRTTPAAATQGYLCITPIDSQLGVALNSQELGSHHLWPTGLAYDWCGSSGAPASATSGWPSWVGTQVGTVRVVLTPRGLQGFRTG